MTSEQLDSLARICMWISWSGFFMLTLGGNWMKRKHEAALKIIGAEVERRAGSNRPDWLLGYVRAVIRYDFEDAKKQLDKLKKQQGEKL